MTPTEFRAALAVLHWTQRGLATILQCDERRVRRWAAGSYPVPSPVAVWLAALAKAHESLPTPRGDRHALVARECDREIAALRKFMPCCR